MKSNFNNIAHEVDELLSSYSSDKLDKIISLFDYKGIEKYYWNKLASINNPAPWFIQLYKKGYFNVENHPAQEATKDKTGKEIIGWEIWIVLGYIENVAKYNRDHYDKKIQIYLENIVNSIINCDKCSSPHTIFMLTSIIGTFDPKRINKNQLAYIHNAYRNGQFSYSYIQSQYYKAIIPSLIKGERKELLEYTIDKMLDYQLLDESKYDRYKPLFEEYWLNEIVDNYLKDIVKICGVSVLIICFNKIKSIIKINKNEFLYFSSLVNGGFDGYKYKLIEYTCKTIELLNGHEIYDLIKSRINNRTIFKRLAIYSIDKHYCDLKSLLWQTKRNLINNGEIRGELYRLFLNNSKEFNNNEINIVINWIENANYHLPSKKEIDNKQRKEIKAYRKRQWLKSLLPSNNHTVEKLYDEYGLTNSKEPEAPYFGMKFSGFTYGGYSPIPEAFFNDSTIDEIINKLVDVQKDPEVRRNGVSSIQQVLQSSVSKNPSKYIDGWDKYLALNKHWQESLIGGINTAWNNKLLLDWGKVFDYLDALVLQDKFLEIAPEDTEYSITDTLIFKISDLITDGVKIDDNAFDVKYIDKAIELAFCLDKNTEANITNEKVTKDYVAASLNSRKARLITTLIHLSLRSARQKTLLENNHNYTSNWITVIQEYFTAVLSDSKKRSLEHTIVLAEYLPNIHYLNKAWTEEYLPKIFNENDSVTWCAAFESYVTYYANVYKEIYELIKKVGYYKKGITERFSNENTVKSLTQHICIGYYWGWDQLEDENGLISQLINKGKAEHLKEIVDFFRRAEQNLEPAFKGRIKPLWKAMLGRLTIEISSDSEHVLASLVCWGDLVDVVDEEVYGYLVQSIKYLKEYHNLTDFIDTLNKNVTKTPEYVGKLLYLSVTQGIYAEYLSKEFINLIEKLYQQNQKDVANQVCNLYGEIGKYELRELYDKYNQ